MKLRADCAIDPPLKSAGRLTAIWRAKPEPASWRLDHWNKKDGNGVTERYKWHAQSAAARQGFAGTGDEAVSFWLEQIRRDAPKSHIRRTLIEREGSDEVYSVEILDICGLSAEYCRKCEADEIRSGAASVKTPTNWPELPPKFQNAFEAAKAKAELEYSNRAERFPHHPDLANNPLHRLKLILDVFFAFCTEARQVCREGSWTVAQARQAVEAALPLICDFYFDQDHGGHPDGAKSAFRAAVTPVVTDDPQWKQHLSDLATLAERALGGTRKDGSRQTITEGPIRAGRGARPQIEKFANDTFSVARDRILEDHAQELNRLPGRVRPMGNSGAYLPARIKLEKEYLRTMLLAQADAWLEAFELFRVPCDAQTERDLRTCAQQMTGGSISAIRGDLRLRSGRLRIAEEGRGMPWHLEIERSMDSAVKEGVLRLRRQQITAKSSEGFLQRGLPAAGRAEVPRQRPKTAVSKKASLKPQFPNRASWLKERLRERSWSKHDLARHRGPDRKTTEKMLDGLSVREDVLEKLAIGLSKKGTKVTVLDIPSD